MNHIVLSDGLGKTKYCTLEGVKEIFKKGCPHCGSKTIVEGTHPTFGGTFFQCERHCRNSDGVRWVISIVPVKSRKKNLKATHAFRSTGF